MVKQAGTRINLISSCHVTENMWPRENNTNFDWSVSANSVTLIIALLEVFYPSSYSTDKVTYSIYVSETNQFITTIIIKFTVCNVALYSVIHV